LRPARETDLSLVKVYFIGSFRKDKVILPLMTEDGHKHR